MTPSHQNQIPSLQGASWLAQPQTRAVFRALAAGGHVSRCVGGAVRNALLGEPVNDIDIATTAKPHEAIACAQAAGLQVIPTGLRHGTVTILCDHVAYEVTSLRQDIETDGRHAIIAFTSDWTMDAQRRDFTMNALYCDAEGTVFDPLGGYDDLIARRVRFISDARARITEDNLRILRFFRFNAQYGVRPQGGTADAPHQLATSANSLAGNCIKIDQEGLAACLAERGGLAMLSAERIRVELLKLLAAPHALAICQIMSDTGFWPGLLGAAPRMTQLRSVIRAQELLGQLPDPALRLAAFSIAVKDDVARLSTRLALSKAQTKIVQLASDVVGPDTRRLYPGCDANLAKITLYQLGASAYKMRVILDLAHFLGRDAAASIAAPSDQPSHDPTTMSGSANSLKQALADVDVETWRQLYLLPDREPVPSLPISGADIVALGIAPGPLVGQIMRRFETWWLATGLPVERALVAAKLAAITTSPDSLENSSGHHEA